MHKLACLVAVVGACGSPTSAPIAQPTGPMAAATPPIDPTTLQPSAVASSPGPVAPAQAPLAPPPPPPLPTCVDAQTSTAEVALTADGFAFCAVDAATTTANASGLRNCWAISIATGKWTALATMPLADTAPANDRPTARLENGNALVCDPTGLACQTVTVPGLTSYTGGNVGVAASNNRELVVVYRFEDARVFEVKTGKLLTTIKSWHNDPANPSGIMHAYFVGGSLPGTHDVVELYASDSPVSSSARLYDPRTGKQIGSGIGVPDKKLGYPEIAEIAPIVFGDNQWLFASFPLTQLYVHDIRTGKYIKTIKLYAGDDLKAVGNAPVTAAMLARSRDGKSILAVPNAPYSAPPVAIDLATSSVKVLHPPLCK
jgi:hypothetical protein